MNDLGSDLRALLAPLRCRARAELVLQDLIAEVLARAEIAFEREVRLSAHDRIDFVCGSIGVEAKVDGSLTAITRQLHRYAQSDRLAHLMLVTTRMRHLTVPRSFNGKRVEVVHLIGGSL